jgi:hypothetical protein
MLVPGIGFDIWAPLFTGGRPPPPSVRLQLQCTFCFVAVGPETIGGKIPVVLTAYRIQTDPRGYSGSNTKQSQTEKRKFRKIPNNKN